MRYPEYLKEEGVIGLVAPSFGCTFEPYKSCMDAAIKRFKAMGYEIVEGPNCRRDDGIGISSTPENCGKDLIDSIFRFVGENIPPNFLIRRYQTVNNCSALIKSCSFFLADRKSNIYTVHGVTSIN